jgi:hypothetical protein
VTEFQHAPLHRIGIRRRAHHPVFQSAGKINVLFDLIDWICFSIGALSILWICGYVLLFWDEFESEDENATGKRKGPKA